MIAGIDGPVVVISARVADLLERHTDVSALRVRARGVDPEAAQQLGELRTAALLWRSSACAGTAGDRSAEPAAESEQSLSTTQAADLLGVTDRGVRKAIAEKRLVAVREDRGWRIDRRDLEHYRAAREAA